MAALRQQAFPLGDYPSGTNQFGPFNVRPQDELFQLQVRRCTTADPTIWPNVATTLELTMELSVDNGATWQQAGGFKAEGGIIDAGPRGEVEFTSYKTDLGQGNQRRLRGSVTIINGPLRTEGFLDLLDAP